MEKQSGYTIKILRKDRDTEYTIYDYFLKKKVILNINWLQGTHYNKKELQREKNRTIMDMVRCMLHLK